jgi:AhpD family alkylhydroperoxidase
MSGTDWRQALRQVAPEADAAVAHLLATTSEGELPRRQKQLLAMVAAAMARDAAGVRRHAAEAMYLGASDGEIVEALAHALPAGGLPVLAAAIEALADLLTPASAGP